MRRFLWWLFRKGIRPMPELGERVFTGYTTLIVTEMVASTNVRGEHVVTLTLVKQHWSVG